MTSFASPETMLPLSRDTSSQLLKSSPGVDNQQEGGLQTLAGVCIDALGSPFQALIPSHLDNLPLGRFPFRSYTDPASCRGLSWSLSGSSLSGSSSLPAWPLSCHFPVWGSIRPPAWSCLPLPGGPGVFLCDPSCWPQLRPAFLHLLGHPHRSRGRSPLVPLEKLPAPSRDQRSLGKVSQPPRPRQTPICPTSLLFPETVMSPHLVAPTPAFSVLQLPFSRQVSHALPSPPPPQGA